MAYSRTAPRTNCRARRVRPGVLVAALAVALVAAATVLASQLLAGGVAGTFGGDGSGGLSAVGRWPAHGQAAVAFGGGRPGKTGSDSAAGGCLAFFTHVTRGGHRVTAVGVVMGQGQGSDTAALLNAAGEAAVRLVGSAGGAGSGDVAMRPPRSLSDSAPSP